MAAVNVMGARVTVYDESNYSQLVRQSRSGGGSFGTGFEAGQMGGFGSVAGVERVGSIPRSEWPDRIKDREAKGGFPSHWFKRGGVRILSQRSYNYCWMYGTVGAMQCAYAMAGHKSPHLNAFPPAYRGKNGRNVGGWAGEAIGYIDQYGVPTMDAFPDQSTRQSDFQSEKYLASAAKHKVAKFSELPRKNFNALMNHFLGPNPSPVTLGLMWWGHLVYGIAPVVTGGSSVGVLIVNSWAESWGDRGLAVLSEQKATADEQFAVRAVSPV